MGLVYYASTAWSSHKPLHIWFNVGHDFDIRGCEGGSIIIDVPLDFYVHRHEGVEVGGAE